MSEVNVNFLNFGSPPVFGFSDTFATAPANPRNIFAPPSDDWIWLFLGGDTPFSQPVTAPSFVFGNLLSGGGGTGMTVTAPQWGANPTYNLVAGICPRVCYVGSRYYNATQKFVQYTFNNVANGSVGIGMGNFVDATGTGAAGAQQICHDFYFVDQGGGGAGNPGLIRFNSGAVRTILNAGTGTLQQGDIVRVSCDFTNSSQASVTVKVNGATAYTQVDNAANRLTGPAFPVVGGYSFGNAFAWGCKNFICGVGL